LKEAFHLGGVLLPVGRAHSAAIPVVFSLPSGCHSRKFREEG